MPLTAEALYWEEQAASRLARGLNDNVWKRAEIVRRVLGRELFGSAVLEIGLGPATAAAAVNIILLGHWDYTGTDVSESWVDNARKRWGLRAVHADITELPDGPYHQLWAFDTLEHISPAQRDAGWGRMGEVLLPGGRLLINNPLDDSEHDPQFDHSLRLDELHGLCGAMGGKVVVLEEYGTEVGLTFQWIEVEKQ